MSIFERISRLADRLAVDRVDPDPATATREEIAAYCGIEHPSLAPEDAVPVEAYRQQGVIACERSGQEPDPPWRVVARFALPDGSRAVLSHDVAAVAYAEAHDLDDAAAEVLALHRAGWTSQDMQQSWSPLGHRAADAPELLQDAKRATGDSLTKHSDADGPQTVR